MSSSKSVESDCTDQLRRGPWTLEEDTLLIHYIASHGEGRWNLLAKRSGLKRTGKSCRLRWLNYLKPDVKRGNFSPQEQISILELHSKWGNRWSKIAQHLPGRTDNEIKNYWRTRVQKQARHLKIDANSTAFQDIIRCFWMPRLLQKMQGSESTTNYTQSSSITTTQQQYQPIHDPQHNHINTEYKVPEAVNYSINNNNSLVNQFQDYSINQFQFEDNNMGWFDLGTGVGFDGPVGCHMAENYWMESGFGENHMWNEQVWQETWGA